MSLVPQTLPTLPEAGPSHRGGVCAGRRAREAAAQSQHSSCRPWLFSLRTRWGSLAQKSAIPRGQRQRRSRSLLPWPCGLGCFPRLLGGARRRLAARTERAAGNSRLPAGERLKRLRPGDWGGASGGSAPPQASLRAANRSSIFDKRAGTVVQ